MLPNVEAVPSHEKAMFDKHAAFIVALNDLTDRATPRITTSWNEEQDSCLDYDARQRGTCMLNRSTASLTSRRSSS